MLFDFRIILTKKKYKNELEGKECIMQAMQFIVSVWTKHPAKK